MNLLFNTAKDQDNLDTSFVYGINFYPRATLNFAQKTFIAWNKTVVITKANLLLLCNEDLNKIKLREPKNKKDVGDPFQINWAYNNQPTETEWNKIPSDRKFQLEYRISGLIYDSGRAAIIVPLSLLRRM